MNKKILISSLILIILILSGCKSLTPEQKIGLHDIYKNIKKNSEKVELKSYDSTPEILSNLRFQERCAYQQPVQKPLPPVPPEIKTYLIIQLDVTNYNCRSQKNYIGTKDKDNTSAYFFFDNENEKVICVINDDICRDQPVKNITKEEACPFPIFKCSRNDYTIKENSAHIELINTLPYMPTNIGAMVGAYVAKDDYGKPDAKRGSQFYNYCIGSSITTKYSAGRIIVDINNCDFPILNNIIYLPIYIEYTNNQGIADSIGTTITTRKKI